MKDKESIAIERDEPNKSKEKEKDAGDKTQEMSDEDRLLQEELEMLISRLKESDVNLYLPALEQLRSQIRSATTSMTSVPKPLKFLRDHYDTLKNIHENIADEECKRFAADIISILAMTLPQDKCGPGEALRYRLKGSHEDIGSWGHEYVRHIASEIAVEWQNDIDDESRGKLLKLVNEIVPYHMKHNAEAEAADLLMEIEKLDLLDQYIDNEDVCQRVCLYLTSCVAYVPDPENTVILKTAMRIFLNYKKYPDALRIAMRLNDVKEIQSILTGNDDPAMQKQLAFMIGRHQMFNFGELPDGDLVEIVSNTHLNSHFLSLGRELDILEPKIPEDIYKSHLESSTRSFSGNIDSARANLASSFVNGFVNCGFGMDKLLLAEDGNKWLYKNQVHGQFSTIASLGLILLWDVDSGLTKIDKYLYSSEPNIKAGALLACGMVNCGVKSECDPALALLAEYVTNNVAPMKIGAIMGLGLAYAGSNREDVINTLLPVLTGNHGMEVTGIAAISCGLIAVGSGNGNVITTCLHLMMERDAESTSVSKNEPFEKFLPLAIGLCCLGRQDDADAVQGLLDVINNEDFRSMSKTLVDICVYAATGNVLKIQQLLHICSEKSDKEANEAGDESDKKNDKSGNVSDHSLQQAVATLGIALISCAEEIGCEMAFRTFGHLLRYGNSAIKKTVPLALALISVSNPKLNILETLSKFSHDTDSEVACNAIFAMGIIGAGTNNSRLSTMLRQLAQYHSREPNPLFMTRIAQGLTHLGKGTLTLSPFHSDRQLLVPTALGGILIVLVSLLNPKTIFGSSHYLLYCLTAAIQPRMLVTFDEELKPLPVSVRVGQAVDVVGQAGRPKTITGFQTHTTPVLLSHGERAELATEEYISLTPVLEGFVILKKNPHY